VVMAVGAAAVVVAVGVAAGVAAVTAVTDRVRFVKP
jgi:hypothetical protein